MTGSICIALPQGGQVRHWRDGKQRPPPLAATTTKLSLPQEEGGDLRSPNSGGSGSRNRSSQFALLERSIGSSHSPTTSPLQALKLGSSVAPASGRRSTPRVAPSRTTPYSERKTTPKTGTPDRSPASAGSSSKPSSVDRIQKNTAATAKHPSIQSPQAQRPAIYITAPSPSPTPIISASEAKRSNSQQQHTDVDSDNHHAHAGAAAQIGASAIVPPTNVSNVNVHVAAAVSVEVQENDEVSTAIGDSHAQSAPQTANSGAIEQRSTPAPVSPSKSTSTSSKKRKTATNAHPSKASSAANDSNIAAVEPAVAAVAGVRVVDDDNNEDVVAIDVAPPAAAAVAGGAAVSARMTRQKDKQRAEEAAQKKANEEAAANEANVKACRTHFVDVTVDYILAEMRKLVKNKDMAPSKGAMEKLKGKVDGEMRRQVQQFQEYKHFRQLHPPGTESFEECFDVWMNEAMKKAKSQPGKRPSADLQVFGDSRKRTAMEWKQTATNVAEKEVKMTDDEMVEDGLQQLSEMKAAKAVASATIAVKNLKAKSKEMGEMRRILNGMQSWLKLIGKEWDYDTTFISGHNQETAHIAMAYILKTHLKLPIWQTRAEQQRWYQAVRKRFGHAKTAAKRKEAIHPTKAAKAEALGLVSKDARTNALAKALANQIAARRATRLKRKLTMRLKTLHRVLADSKVWNGNSDLHQKFAEMKPAIERAAMSSDVTDEEDDGKSGVDNALPTTTMATTATAATTATDNATSKSKSKKARTARIASDDDKDDNDNDNGNGSGSESGSSIESDTKSERKRSATKATKATTAATSKTTNKVAKSKSKSNVRPLVNRPLRWRSIEFTLNLHLLDTWAETIMGQKMIRARRQVIEKEDGESIDRETGKSITYSNRKYGGHWVPIDRPYPDWVYANGYHPRIASKELAHANPTTDVGATKTEKEKKLADAFERAVVASAGRRNLKRNRDTAAAEAAPATAPTASTPASIALPAAAATAALAANVNATDADLANGIATVEETEEKASKQHKK